VDHLEIDNVDLCIGNTCLLRNGSPNPEYSEQAGQNEVNKKDICITVDLHLGEGNACIWTSDLSYDYVRINAEYRS